MPFLPTRPAGEPFGTWLKRQARENDGSPAAEIAHAYAADIAGSASPRDVRDAMRFRRVPDDDYGALVSAVRQWLAESIPMHHLADWDDNLVVWPHLWPVTHIEPPAEDVTCVLCGAVFAGPFPAMVAACWPDEEPGLACEDCAPAYGSRFMWEMVRSLRKGQEPSH